MALGKMIGVIKHTFKISEYKGGPSTQLTINVDFSTATDTDIKNWLVSNRVIAGQRPWRSLSVDELNELNGKTFIAQNIGQKVRSRDEQIQGLINAGLPDNLAAFAVDNPSEFNKVMTNVNTSSGTDDTPDDDEIDEEDEE